MNYVEIPLDVPRRMRFTINAMAELEEYFGDQGMAQIFSPQRAGFKQVRALLWIGLKNGSKSQSTLSLEEAGDLIQEHWLEKGKTLADLFVYVMKAMKKANILPDEQEETAQPNPPKAAQETGQSGSNK